jgi:hypothetical protein
VARPELGTFLALMVRARQRMHSQGGQEHEAGVQRMRQATPGQGRRLIWRPFVV